MKREAMTAILRFRVTRELDEAVRQEARRLRCKTHDVARVALARGLRGLSDPQTMEVTNNERQET